MRLLGWNTKTINHRMAIFRQVSKEKVAAHHDALEIPDPLAQWMLFLSLGVSSLWAAVGHAFMTEQVAKSIGWAPQPVSTRDRGANLGVGLGAVVATVLGPAAAWVAFIVAASFHVLSMERGGHPHWAHGPEAEFRNQQRRPGLLGGCAGAAHSAGRASSPT